VHYPFENKEWFDSHFPSDFIVEYIAQTRGWFYNMMILTTALFDDVPFKTAICHGVVVDAEGKKLSKSKRNYPDPTDIIETLGSDALRWFLMSSPILSGGNLSIDKDGMEINKAARQVIMPLWNVYYFFTLYANAEGVKATETAGATDILDKYILSKLRTLIAKVTELLDANRINDSAPLFAEFMEVLNNWYIRRSRNRFWDGKDQSAFDTLYTVLTTLCRALAPYLPMTAEYIYKGLTGEESVHLADWPDAGGIAHEPELEDAMDNVQQIVATGKALREKYKLRNRLPLEMMEIYGRADFGGMEGDVLEIIKDELNIRNIVLKGTDSSSVATSENGIYFDPIKKDFGMEAFLKIKNNFKDGKIIPNPNGRHPFLRVLDFNLESPKYWDKKLTVRPGVTGAALPDNTAVLVLDTKVTPELAAEGLANDTLRFIQDTRKMLDMDVSDRIVLDYSADPELAGALEAHRARITADALIVEMRAGRGEHETEIEGRRLSIAIRKA
jgi:isoleucyl-tRNA synthetase